MSHHRAAARSAVRRRPQGTSAELTEPQLEAQPRARDLPLGGSKPYLLEVARSPSSTDVPGTHEVVLDGDGDLLRHERTRRYLGGQIGAGA